MKITISILYLISLILVYSCSSDNDFNTILEYTTGLNLNYIELYEVITPYEHSHDEIENFYLLSSFDDLLNFQSTLFNFDINLDENYFENNILIIHPKATYSGPIDDLNVSLEGDKVIVSYNWEDGGADCLCYVLIVIYISINE